jgi:two-component system CheB/CheR fusion protein
VILSGAGSDGAVRVRDVKDAGGITLVQDPDEAEYPSMPRSAIATGIADLVLPVRDLAARLVPLIRSRQSAEAGEEGVDEELVHRVLAQVRVRTGHDFSRYKRSTVLRRILRRLQVTRSDDVNGYYEHLRENPEEAQALLTDLLIPSPPSSAMPMRSRRSEAGRAADHRRQGRDRKRACGCPLRDRRRSLFGRHGPVGKRRVPKSVPHQVFGRISMRALALGAKVLSGRDRKPDVSEEQLRRFFTREKSLPRAAELRDNLFASHSLLKDPPFSRIDLVSYRNPLIRRSRAQQQVCSTFHYALNPAGSCCSARRRPRTIRPGCFAPSTASAASTSPPRPRTTSRACCRAARWPSHPQAPYRAGPP